MKIIRILCFILTAALLASFTAYAAESYVTMNGFMFNKNDDGKAVIHEYTGNAEDVVIPQTLLNAEVTAIDDSAFFGRTQIKSVSFEQATALKSIGSCAFYGCTALTELNIPAVALSFGSFQNCTGLRSVVIQNGLETIPSQAFSGCSSLISVEIPDSVTSIAANAFNNCPKLTIFCNEGSYAQTYAETKKLQYLLIREFELGDVNLDGTISIRDVTTIQLFIVGKIEDLPVFRGKSYADTTKDGKVNIRDATMIQLKLAEYIQHF
ncbi:MAG: leucine-rich repeat protein [Ruminococcus sp.]|nr:leucine-rich repeat protein [Ruminococcus sp.]